MSAEPSSLDDKKIAKYVREIFIGTFNADTAFPNFFSLDKKIISDLLSGLAFILLGCEAARNSGMFVTNQMLLDLIAAGSLTWEKVLNNEAVTPRLMPMAPKGAINIARQLNRDYKEYMPYRYLYDHGDDATENKKVVIKTQQQLMMLEAFIFSQ